MLEQHLSKVVYEYEAGWDQLVTLFLMAYRSVIHEMTVVLTNKPCIWERNSSSW